ncbi:hypothetical protein GTW25_06575 [Aliihoeflea aestuarii]|uniref:hypothetical protein n=1 Tax=Aliihoeflea aestuarii TaxID=453840 RepID=UPI0020927C41|nr:hypothetical protein [Aliihoeflea aestuarii]MCO6390692.1 hypothetical protein [Aliihoeflea aestuarii]
MRKTLPLVLFLSVFSGCTTLDEGREAEVINSIRYDDTPCPQLISERNALAARHGLSPAVQRTPATESRFMGVGPLIPDLRGQETREQGLAIGQIDAMNRSITRRACESQQS